MAPMTPLARCSAWRGEGVQLSFEVGRELAGERRHNAQGAVAVGAVAGGADLLGQLVRGDRLARHRALRVRRAGGDQRRCGDTQQAASVHREAFSDLLATARRAFATPSTPTADDRLPHALRM